MPPPLISSDTTRNRPSHRSLIVVLEKGFSGETNERCFEVTLYKTYRTGAPIIISTKTPMTILKRIALANVTMKMKMEMKMIKVMIAFQGMVQG